MTATEQLLCDLIALPSVNPALAPAGDPHTGELRVAEYLAARLGGAGLTVEFCDALPGRANLLCRLAPLGPVRHRVILAPHLDTVGGGELPGKLFTPEIKGERIYGRGACDTKGSIAVMVRALEALARTPGRPRHTELIFAGLVDEEFLQGGSRALARQRLGADLAIVGEPTGLRVVTAHKGVLWYELKTHGKAAHGSRPELGVNAVHTMARIVEVLLTDYATELRQRRRPVVGQPTISVGSIQGGHQPNIVPNECVCTIDRRTVPGETEAGILRELKALLRRHKLKAEWRPLQKAPCPPLATSPDHPLVRQFLACAGQRKPARADFFSDAGVLAQGRIPSILFGPGDIAQAHTLDEWIDRRQLADGAELLERFLRTLP